ncbi:MAG: A/G-specific adenine glycosylase [Caldibacillus sp.]
MVKNSVQDLLHDFPIQDFQSDLIQWFQKEKRDLPWRKDKDPYKIWVSEVMLQQTRVDTVIPYFERFMEKYPTLEHLAEADEQELLKIWEGLGYYSRVRNLHHAVREVKEKYGGVVPDNRKEFQKLKGVGSYTAGAVLSIAYNLPEPAVDGNVMRVLSRVLHIDEDISKAKTKKKFETIVAEMISREDPSSFNQGLMELGALVCTPRSPACLLCPVRDYCRAFKLGKSEDLPVKNAKKRNKTVKLIAAVLEDPEGNIVLRQRPPDGLLASLWEFPNEEVTGTLENPLAFLEKTLKEKHGFTSRIHKPLGTITHKFSHLTWEIDAYRGKVGENIQESETLKAVSRDEITSTYPLPVPHQIIWQKFIGN